MTGYVKRLLIAGMLISLVLLAACGEETVSETSSQAVVSSEAASSEAVSSEEAALSDEVQKQLEEVEAYRPCVVHFTAQDTVTEEADIKRIIEEAYESIGVDFQTVAEAEDYLQVRGNCFMLHTQGASLKTTPELLPALADALYRREDVRKIVIDSETLAYDLMTEEEKWVQVYAELTELHVEGNLILLSDGGWETAEDMVATAKAIMEAAEIDTTEMMAAYEADPTAAKTAFYDLDLKNNYMILFLAEEKLADALYAAREMPIIETAHLNVLVEFVPF